MIGNDLVWPSPTDPAFRLDSNYVRSWLVCKSRSTVVTKFQPATAQASAPCLEVQPYQVRNSSSSIVKYWRSCWSDFVLPLIIFPVLLGLGCKYIYAEHIAAGLSESISALCPPSFQNPTHPPFTLMSSKAYLRSYTFISSVDYVVCRLIAFFHLLLDSPFHAPRKFMSYLFGTGPPFVITPFIEAYRYRGKQHWLLRYPTFWLMMSQIVTLGIVSTIYWPLLLISRARSSEAEENNKRTNSGTKNLKKTYPGREKVAKLMGPAQAEGLAFGLATGYLLPSVATVLHNNPFTTWIWQLYPMYVAFARAVYIALRAPHTDNENETKETLKPHRQNAIRTLYIACFLITSITHILFVWPLFQDSDWKVQTTDFLIPLRPTTGAHPSRHAHNLFKWDYALGYGSILVGLLWSARSFGQVVMMVLWYAIAIPAFGVGGAVMGILAWRDLLEVGCEESNSWLGDGDRVVVHWSMGRETRN